MRDWVWFERHVPLESLPMPIQEEARRIAVEGATIEDVGGCPEVHQCAIEIGAFQIGCGNGVVLERRAPAQMSHKLDARRLVGKAIHDLDCTFAS